MRALLKLSGQILKGSDGDVINRDYLWQLAGVIKQAQQSGHQLAIVVGGGNLYRFAANRRDERDQDLNPTFAHARGLLSTVFNGLWLVDVFRSVGIPTELLTSVFVDPQFTTRFEPVVARAHLDAGTVLILAGGTGEIGPSTDVGAVRFAQALNIPVVLKATHTVDGVYTADPVRNPSATKLTKLTYGQALTDHLAIMDEIALEEANQSSLETIVFSIADPANLTRVLAGETIGSTITTEHE